MSNGLISSIMTHDEKKRGNDFLQQPISKCVLQDYRKLQRIPFRAAGASTEIRKNVHPEGLPLG
jgi:hypothetical protein